MKKLHYLLALLLLVGGVMIWGCSDDNGDDGGGRDTFDRGVMLEHWADEMIVPAYVDFGGFVADLSTATNDFITQPDQARLDALRNAWEQAYLSWQSVSMFSVGPAEDEFLRRFLNTYPADTTQIQANILSGDASLEGSTTFDEQGFPALDYMLYGLAGDDASILSRYTDLENAQAHRAYLQVLVVRISTLTNRVLLRWQGDYRDEFVNNDGGSALSSTNRLVNDYIQYYERNFRDGKIGIPAGIRSEGVPQPTRVEAVHRRDLSKRLFMEALGAYQDFFNGTGYEGDSRGESLASYLDFLNTMKDGEDLSSLINQRFEAIRTAAGDLDDDYVTQINSDNTAMVEVFDRMQDGIVLLKSDMTSALSITIDFVDSDGD